MLIRSQRPSRVAHRAAFTLLEVLIVAAIIVVLAGASTLFYMRYLEDSKYKRAKVDVKTIETAITAYTINNNNNPPDSLQQLISPPDGTKPYLQNGVEGITDPWNHPYQYDPAGGHNGGQKPDVWAQAPDGRMVGNWPGQ